MKPIFPEAATGRHLDTAGQAIGDISSALCLASKHLFSLKRVHDKASATIRSSTQAMFLAADAAWLEHLLFHQRRALDVVGLDNRGLREIMRDWRRKFNLELPVTKAEKKYLVNLLWRIEELFPNLLAWQGQEYAVALRLSQAGGLGNAGELLMSVMDRTQIREGNDQTWTQGLSLEAVSMTAQMAITNSKMIGSALNVATMLTRLVRTVRRFQVWKASLDAPDHGSGTKNADSSTRSRNLASARTKKAVNNKGPLTEMKLQDKIASTFSEIVSREVPDLRCRAQKYDNPSRFVHGCALEDIKNAIRSMLYVCQYPHDGSSMLLLLHGSLELVYHVTAVLKLHEANLRENFFLNFSLIMGLLVDYGIQVGTLVKLKGPETENEENRRDQISIKRRGKGLHDSALASSADVDVQHKAVSRSVATHDKKLVETLPIKNSPEPSAGSSPSSSSSHHFPAGSSRSSSSNEQQQGTSSKFSHCGHSWLGGLVSWDCIGSNEYGKITKLYSDQDYDMEVQFSNGRVRYLTFAEIQLDHSVRLTSSGMCEAQQFVFAQEWAGKAFLKTRQATGAAAATWTVAPNAVGHALNLGGYPDG
ncbi:unnamed protein product [Amoebophrya sp. A25]|nr:unnamed protein product [Amoebophrya sp. A25]|eukprot:GSA25T00015489001.1